MIRHTSLDEPS